MRAGSQHYADPLFIAGKVFACRVSSVSILPFGDRDIDIGASVFLINRQVLGFLMFRVAQFDKPVCIRTALVVNSDLQPRAAVQTDLRRVRGVEFQANEISRGLFRPLHVHVAAVARGILACECPAFRSSIVDVVRLVACLLISGRLAAFVQQSDNTDVFIINKKA